MRSASLSIAPEGFKAEQIGHAQLKGAGEESKLFHMYLCIPGPSLAPLKWTKLSQAKEDNFSGRDNEKLDIRKITGTDDFNPLVHRVSI